MPIREMNAALSDELLEVIFGIGDEIALEDPTPSPASPPARCPPTTRSSRSRPLMSHEDES